MARSTDTLLSFFSEGTSMNSLARMAAAACLVALGAGTISAQTVDPFYAGNYSYADLGSVPGVPARYGGLTLKYDDPNTLLIGGEANAASGALYAINVTRDMDNHIIGFSGSAMRFADAAFNDGGVAYEPASNVLFASRWPVNQLGQTRPGSSITDKIIDLAPLGVAGSHAALNFIPTGFGPAGRLKLVSWGGGQWYDAEIAPDGTGLFDLATVTAIPASNLGGGPEGFAYVPLGSPLFSAPSMVVSEFSAGNVATYELDANGDPIVASRRTLMSGLSGAEGAFIDPLTGDFLFSTFGGGDRVVVVHGFVPEPTTFVLAALAGVFGLRRR
ncbi:hypothetical protein RAS1_21370 [Phycisphaerae bacterium RAS1]|nr:hypothetical protein RAS1_21370 [Phycisphaerae bacterium RAS1]